MAREDYIKLCRCESFKTYIMLLIHQPTYALNKIYSRTSLKFLHVLALGCHYHGVIQNKAVQAQHANLGIVSPLLE
jgi:hypothetical protein